MIAKGSVEMPRKRKSKPKTEVVADHLPKPRVFVPRPCNACEAQRPKATSFSKVLATRGDVRYCRCEFCGNRWTQAKSAATETGAPAEIKVDADTSIPAP